MSRQIFLSRVSSEFQELGEFMASKLRGPGVDVKVQEDFSQGGATLLERLDDYIRGCDAVVHVVGSRCGSSPNEVQVAALRQRYPDLVDRLRLPPERLDGSPGGPTYTQWEFWLALYHRKHLFVSRYDGPALPLAAATDADEQARRQQEHWDAVAATGLHRSKFTGTPEITIEVLRSLHDLLPATHRPNNLPFPTLGTLFKGRDEFLNLLRKKLQHAAGLAVGVVAKQQQEPGGARHAVHGLGGIGKTRLAVEYAWRHEDDYSALLFVAAETPDELRSNLAALCGPLVLDLPEQGVKDEEARTAAALKWLADHPGWFLIFDNVDTPAAAEAVEELLSRLSHGHLVITSRLADWSAGVEPLELDVLEENGAVDFLLERTHGRRREQADDRATAAELARELGYLALALEQAGAFIALRRSSFREYLDRWRAKDAKVREWFDERLMHYPRSVATTWQTSFELLDDDARRLLQALSWLAPDPLPPFLFPAESQDALAQLTSYSLVKRQADGGATVHRLVQEMTREQIPEAERNATLESALELVSAAGQGDSTDVRTWPVWDALRPHILVVVEHAEAAKIHEPTTRLMNAIGLLLKLKCLFTPAEALYRRALKIDEAALGLEHPEVAIDLNNLASLLLATNRLGEAEPLMRRALEIDERSFGNDHPNVAIRLNNLAQLLKATNRLAEAEPVMRRALEIDERAFGNDHPKVAIRLNNLAQLLQDTNRLAEAEPLKRRALEIDERAFGNDHPRVAIRLNNLASLLNATNRLAEAEPLMQRVLAIDEAAFGPDHPEIAADLNNLAQLLQATNRKAEAEPLMRRALEIDERSFGNEHPKVALRLNNLAQLLQETNRLAEAEPLMRRATLIFLKFGKSTGHQHPHLETVLQNYWFLLKNMNLGDAEVEQRIRSLREEVNPA